jgi:hypothetical protein
MAVRIERWLQVAASRLLDSSDRAIRSLALSAIPAHTHTLSCHAAHLEASQLAVLF